MQKPDYKARFVICGFKDLYPYELCETYVPVSCLSLVRVYLATVNKKGLTMWQLAVKSAFVQSQFKTQIFMEISEGFVEDENERETKVWLLKKSLYGLKTSLKNWNECFTKHVKEQGFVANDRDPCLFLINETGILVILLLYVGDILLVGNNDTLFK